MSQVVTLPSGESMRVYTGKVGRRRFVNLFGDGAAGTPTEWWVSYRLTGGEIKTCRLKEWEQFCLDNGRSINHVEGQYTTPDGKTAVEAALQDNEMVRVVELRKTVHVFTLDEWVDYALAKKLVRPE